MLIAAIVAAVGCLAGFFLVRQSEFVVPTGAPGAGGGGGGSGSGGGSGGGHA
jgi:hypothetical protein